MFCQDTIDEAVTTFGMIFFPFTANNSEEIGAFIDKRGKQNKGQISNM